MKKQTVVWLTAALVLGTAFSGCGAKSDATREAAESEKTEKEGKGADAEAEESLEQRMVGISMPARRETETIAPAQIMHLQLEQDGYLSRIVYAEELETQRRQLASLIQEEVAAIIVDPVDPYGLADILAQAAEAQIPVFSYDGLVMDSEAVSYYLTYNTRNVGQMTAQRILSDWNLPAISLEEASSEADVSTEQPAVTEMPAGETAGEEASEAGTEDTAFPLTVELLMGEPDQLSDLYFYNGLMEVLQPYFDSGFLVCPSGRLLFDETALMNNSEAIAKRRLSEFWKWEEGVAPQIVVTADDGIALAAAAFYQEHSQGDFPYITGFGCTKEGVQGLIRGDLAFSILMDGRALAQRCAEAVTTYLQGESPEVDDYRQYDNGVRIVRTIVCDPQLIDRDNYQMLVDDGYFSAEEFS